MLLTWNYSCRQYNVVRFQQIHFETCMSNFEIWSPCSKNTLNIIYVSNKSINGWKTFYWCVDSVCACSFSHSLFLSDVLSFSLSLSAFLGIWIFELLYMLVRFISIWNETILTSYGHSLLLFCMYFVALFLSVRFWFCFVFKL